jgi:N6-adenosine-specific RNA methylase IME4
MNELVKINEQILKPVGLQLPEDLSYDEWMSFGGKLRLINNACLWWWGDWINFGERKYGETYAQALDESDYSYSSLSGAKWVCSQIEFCRRRQNVPLSFYQEIADLGEQEQDELLDECESNNWTRRELREAKRRHKIQKKYAELPTSKFRVIYADPPWEYGNSMPDYFTEQADHYQLMSTEQICAMNIKDISEDDAVLFLWVTSPILEDAFKVIEAWGFEYKTSFIWDKIKHNMGHYNSVRHEFLLVCTKGSCTPDNIKLFDSVISIERTEHSVKPEYFREIIETLYTEGRKIELFARIKPDGWEVYGNEAGI